MSTIKSSTTLTTAYSVEADTTGTLVIQTGATPTTAVTVSSAQVVTLTNALAEASGGTGTTIGYNGFKNRLINSAMVIDQRNAGASVTPTTSSFGFPVDRMRIQLTQNSKLTAQQNAGAITPPTGFKNYLGITSSSAYSVLAGDYFNVGQNIEGYNIADLAWGTANAQTVTLSFKVYSSLTGTFGGAVYNDAGSRSYPFTYSIPVANTWTTISITIAGDTSGTWQTTTATGITVNFSMGTGTTYSGTAGAWAGTYYASATGATSVVGTSGATWYVTGVQLEKGSTATSFDYRPFGTELLLCYRYYYYLGGETPYQNINTCAWFGAGDAVGQFSYPVVMRANPTIAKSGTWSTLGGGGGVSQTLSNDQITTKNVQLGFTGGSGGTSGQATTLRAANDSSLRLTFSAEL
jgi:hypothetical protein